MTTLLLTSFQLFGITIEISVSHLIELLCVLIAVCFIKSLRRVKLGIVVTLCVAWLTLDMLVVNLVKGFLISTLGILGLLLIICGLRTYPSLRKFGIEPLISILIIETVGEIIADYKGWHRISNHLVYSITYLITSLLIYLLFYRLLNLKPRLLFSYRTMVFILIGFYVYEFYRMPSYKAFYYPLMIQQISYLILGFIAVAKLILDDRNIKITRHPWFWLSLYFIIPALIRVPSAGFNFYLVNHHINISRNNWMSYLDLVALLISNICFTVTIFLCRKVSHGKITH